MNFSSLTQKNCPNLPIIIPTFNNPTYLKKITEQLSKYNLIDLIILDNQSSTPEMLTLLNKYEHVVENPTGPYAYLQEKDFYDWLPNYFVITDPDIGFNKDLPSNFLEIMKDLSDRYKKFKVGFALDLDIKEDHILDDPNYHTAWNKPISARLWESQFWTYQIDKTVTDDPIYAAWVDTTFCLVNKKYFTDPCKNALRIAGKYTSQHFGWYKNPPVPKEELLMYYKLAQEKKQVWTHIKV